MRGVATVAAEALIRNDSAAGWLLLAAELVRMVEAIQAAQLARAERLQAEALAGVARRELHGLEVRAHQAEVGERRAAATRHLIVPEGADHPMLPPDGREGRGFDR
jgi:hypothetical protein